MNDQLAPVGVFDSGMGGLSVAREILRFLPGGDLLYAADTAWCPYGDRDEATILNRSLAVVGALVGQGARVVVVACNTASSVALGPLRSAFPSTPIIGLEPAVKPAAAWSRTGRIGVLATTRTVEGARLADLLDRHARSVESVLVAAPGLVDFVERGETSGESLRSTLSALLAPARERDVDVLVLGCTHFPFLRDEIAAVMGPKVMLVDSGAAVARRTRDVLAEAGAPLATGTGRVRVLATGDPGQAGQVAGRLLGRPVESGALRV